MDYRRHAINQMEKLLEVSKKDEADCVVCTQTMVMLHRHTLTKEGKEILAQQLQLLNEYSARETMTTSERIKIADAIAAIICG